ncbi:uncharacterized protein LOC116517887 [Thamnophis elegans]|uniref:uncharacterized protein LOC116517887 n=1 Tax=Thamnophis elegans TaxID=35005 RepID=UPI0013784FDB|nr:uncharacterized protein LOC116517887 [Thamnophis elegans]
MADLLKKDAVAAALMAHKAAWKVLRMISSSLLSSAFRQVEMSPVTTEEAEAKAATGASTEGICKAWFQDLAFNRDNLELINRNKIRKDLAEMYATALFTVDSDFNLDSLPDQLVCFAQHSTLISHLSPAEALSFIARVNHHCSSSNPSASDRQLAHMLVAQVKTFDKQTLIALGQQAMGLTTGQISNLTAQDLVDHKVLESLGKVKDWNRGQFQILVNKILFNYKLDTVEKFEHLGTLAEGLPGNSFDTMAASSIVKLAKNVSFQRAFRKSPNHVKKAFVSKILSNSSLDDILNNVPDDLIEFVPNSLLIFGGQIPDLHKINEKPWSPQQAAVIFGDLFTRIENYTMLSPFILQGFQCDVASKLMPEQLSSLVQEVRCKKANLSEEQLSCMARLLIKSNLTTNLSSYPAGVLLFSPISKVEHQSCEMFYTLASQGNLSLLANGSSQRARLLENALHCFVSDDSLSLLLFSWLTLVFYRAGSPNRGVHISRGAQDDSLKSSMAPNLAFIQMQVKVLKDKC